MKDKRKTEARLGITEDRFEDMVSHLSSRMSEEEDPPPMPKWGGPCVPSPDPMPPEVEHPDLKWARECVKANKGDRVTDEELESLWWDDLMGCYLMGWRGMTLGIETDGHIHS